MTTSIQELMDALAGAGLERVAAPLAEAASPCTRLVPTGEPPSGASCIGGLPRLDRSREWPVWNGSALAHLCQLDLAEVAPHDAARALPAEGLLSFFYEPNQSTWGFDPADRGSWVVRLDAGPNVAPAAAPADLPSEAIFPESGLAFEAALSLPSMMSPRVAQLGLSDAEYDALAELIEAEASPAHQLLGHPQPVQDDMELECQLVSHGLYCGDGSGYESPEAERLKDGAADWCLLLQLDSDDDRYMMWGDLGRLYFWMHRANLADAAFERAWMILQCG